MSRARWFGARALLALGLALAAAGSGCNTYSYLQVHVKLDDGFTLERRAMINTCHLVATGAATADTRLTGCSPPASNDVGTFDFSTFAESGTVNFTLQLFEGLGEATKLGEGSTSVPISSGNAVMGDLTVMYTGPATP